MLSTRPAAVPGAKAALNSSTPACSRWTMATWLSVGVAYSGRESSILRFLAMASPCCKSVVNPLVRVVLYRLPEGSPDLGAPRAVARSSLPTPCPERWSRLATSQSMPCRCVRSLIDSGELNWGPSRSRLPLRTSRVPMPASDPAPTQSHGPQSVVAEGSVNDKMWLKCGSHHESWIRTAA